MSTVWDNRYLVVGLALWLALVFGAFPVTDPSLVMGGSYGDDKPPLLVIAYSGVLAAAVLPVVAYRIRLENRLLGIIVVACCLQYLGTALVVGAPLAAICSSVLGGLLYGSGNVLAVFAWGMLLVRCPDDVRELAFIAAIPLAGVVLLVGNLVFAGHSLASLLLLPIASLGCFWKAHTVVPDSAEGGEHDDRPHVLHQIAPELLKLALVFGLVGFIWQVFATDTSVGTFEKDMMFSVGFILAGAGLCLFVQFSPGMGVGSFVRWTFPIIAAGLLCASLNSAVLAYVACALFACAHAALEAMMRIRAIGLAQRYRPPQSAFVLACGFAAINAGATAGETLFGAARPFLPPGDQTVIVAIFAVLVLVGALIPETAGGSSVRRDRERPAAVLSDSERKARALAAAHALSAREREVLVLMLDGRSGPVIRETLGLSKSTVDTHVRHIYQKTGVTSRQELIDLSQSPQHTHP